MKKKTDLPSFGETVSTTVRCLKDLNRYCPGLVPSFLIYDLFLTLNPYVTIWFSAQLINELAGLRRPEVLWRWVAIIVVTETVLAICKAILLHWKNARKDAYHAQRRCIYADKMLGMDYAEVDKQENRDKLSQVIQNEYLYDWGMGETLHCVDNLYKTVIRIIASISLTVSLFTQMVPENGGGLMVLNHPGFALLLLLLLVGSIVINSRSVNDRTKMWSTLNETSDVTNRLYDAYGSRFIRQKNALDVRMYQMHDLVCKYNRQAYDGYVNSPIRIYYRGKGGVLFAVANNLPTVITGFLYVFVCLKAMGGAFGVGSVTQYISAVAALSQGLSMFLVFVGRIRTSALYLRTTYDFLDIPNTMYQGSLTTEKRSDRQYDVEFKEVSFKYPGSDQWALRHVNMKFKVGSRLAIVGENGSGKTTFIKLLCRLYDPQEGQILLNGIDIRKYNYRNYMDVFAVVFQDFQLLSQPLGANVAGASTYDRDRATKALIDAGFGDRLEALPDGLDTQLYKDFGKNGVEVSGGEAQKIAIARALYKDAPFIILDEPTAALDPIAEAEIYAKFNDISGDKTAIYISHRLSSCKFCDEIAVFHEGAVIQQGTHEELVADESGKYHALWHAQAQYYTEK